MPAIKLTTTDKPHQHQKAGAAERAVRRQQRGEQFRLGNIWSNSLPAVMADQYTATMAKMIRPMRQDSLFDALPGKPAAKSARQSAKKFALTPARAKKSLKREAVDASRGARGFHDRFRKAYPEPKGELEHLNAFTLLVAVVLSAQATDAGVDKATRALFTVADTPQKMLALGEEKVRDYIKTIGLWRNKAKNVIALSREADRRFGGEVPRTPAGSSRCRAPGARPPMSCSTWPSASTPWRSTPMSSASATGSGWRPARRRSKSNRGWRR